MEIFTALVAVEGRRMFVDVAACTGPWRLALRGNHQCGMGLRRRMALAASTLWDDLAGSGLRRVVQLGWTIRCGTSSEDGASDFFNLLTWQWRLRARVKQESEVDMR